LIDESGQPDYDCEMAFTEEKFLSILRKINLDTVLIAHQKNTLTSQNARKTDANSVGEERFQEFIYTDFFEAFEFKNKKNEIFNKSYAFSRGIVEDIRFITGSDCHDWRCYPKETASDNSEFRYTYVKCLPTFRGLVMAITDYRRIKTVNSFFNPAETYSPSIKMTINGVDKEIPLSRGINVIIGDNSIGKSLLLHKITDYRKKHSKLLKTSIAKSYDKYLKQNGITIHSKLSADEIFGFDMQGEVREKFEEEKIKSDEFLRGYYPAAINPAPYRETVQRELNRIFSYLTEKFALDDMESNLGKFPIIDLEKVSAESLTFIGNVSRNNKKVEGYGNVSSDTLTVVEKLKSIEECQWLDDEDRALLGEIESQLRSLASKYDKKKQQAIEENAKIGIFQSVISNFKQQYQMSVSDTQKLLSSYNENLGNAIDRVIELKSRRVKNLNPEITIEKKGIEIRTNRVFEYEFNSRLVVLAIDADYIRDLFVRVFKKDINCFILDMTQQDIADALPYYEGACAGALEALKTRIKEKLDEDFREKYTITQQGTDRTQELSSGFNSKIYFDLLSYETDHNGVYLIDQPEDNISQKAIREYLLDRFKVMGEHRQVIIVTHNPQFIVNLDVDNVIYLGKSENSIIVQSGALEYKNDEYSILDIISTHIEGGLDTLRRRWKRYEKSTKVSDI
jgi:predicted ATPase